MTGKMQLVAGLEVLEVWNVFEPGCGRDQRRDPCIQGWGHQRFSSASKPNFIEPRFVFESCLTTFVLNGSLRPNGFQLCLQWVCVELLQWKASKDV